VLKKIVDKFFHFQLDLLEVIVFIELYANCAPVSITIWNCWCSLGHSAAAANIDW
jgi:hypothetical protein